MGYRNRRSENLISKDDMLARVVGPIREAMEQGKLLWRKPWNAGAGNGLPLNPLRGGPNKDYTGGVNNILLMIASLTNGWSDPRWMGRGQVKKAGYSVKGLTNAKATTIYIPVFGWYDGEDDHGNKVRKKYVRGFREGRVFNAQQIQDESFPKLSDNTNTDPLDTRTGYEIAHAMYKASGVHTIHKGTQAMYKPKMDRIYMPHEGAFVSLDAYHSTRLHETGHSTGHKSRLDRNKFSHFGSPTYAEEELVAELFAAFACDFAGIENAPVRENHAAYLQSWHRRLGEDPKLFLDAVNDAWAAFAYIRERM